MSDQKAISRVTRGHQMTIPKSIRKKLGFQIGDIVELTTDNRGRMVASRLTLDKEIAPLDWTDEFARKHRITEADIVKISRDTRREVFREEYE